MEHARPSMPWESERAEPMGNVTGFATAHDLVITALNYQLLRFYSVLLKRIASDANVRNFIHHLIFSRFSHSAKGR